MRVLERFGSEFRERQIEREALPPVLPRSIRQIICSAEDHEANLLTNIKANHCQL